MLSNQDEVSIPGEKKVDSGHAAQPAGMDRRNFLGRSSVGVIAASLIATVPTGAAVAAPSRAVTQTFKGLGGAVGATLLRLARDIYPHDKLPDRHYLSVIGPYDGRAAGDPAFKSLIVQGVNRLDAVAVKRFGKPYAQLASETERTLLLYDIQESSFFQTVRVDLINQLYNDKSLWPAFGYQGSSYQMGGYLHRGFNDINWL